MRAHNATTALVSGGFTWFTGRVAALCGFDIHHANQLGIDRGVLTGIPTGPASDAALPEARGSRSSFAVEVNRSGTASWSVPMT